MNIDEVKDKLNSMPNNQNNVDNSNNESKENTREVSMDCFLELVNQGIEYAKTIGGIQGFDSIRPFQIKMMVWTEKNIGKGYLGELIDKYPGKRTEIIKRIMALTAEGKSLEDSLINH